MRVQKMLNIFLLVIKFENLAGFLALNKSLHLRAASELIERIVFVPFFFKNFWIEDFVPIVSAKSTTLSNLNFIGDLQFCF